MSRKTRFFAIVHILTLLADHHKPLSSAYLAESAGVNPVTIRKMGSVLRAEGLVKTKSGSTGGLLLARPASDINLRDVYLLVREESPFGVPPENPDESGVIGRNVQGILTGLLEDSEQRMIDALADTTIFDLLKRVQRADGGYRLNM